MRLNKIAAVLAMGLLVVAAGFPFENLLSGQKRAASNSTADPADNRSQPKVELTDPTSQMLPPQDLPEYGFNAPITNDAFSSQGFGTQPSPIEYKPLNMNEGLTMDRTNKAPSTNLGDVELPGNTITSNNSMLSPMNMSSMLPNQNLNSNPKYSNSLGRDSGNYQYINPNQPNLSNEQTSQNMNQQIKHVRLSDGNNTNSSNVPTEYVERSPYFNRGTWNNPVNSNQFGGYGGLNSGFGNAFGNSFGGNAFGGNAFGGNGFGNAYGNSFGSGFNGGNFGSNSWGSNSGNFGSYGGLGAFGGYGTGSFMQDRSSAGSSQWAADGWGFK